MNDAHSYQRLAGVTALASGFSLLVGMVFGLAAVDLNFTALTDPGLVLAVGSRSASLFGWVMVADIFGYLLLVPAALCLWYWLRPKSPRMADLYTVGGLTYLVIGAIGAGFLWMAWPFLIKSYGGAGVQERAAIEVIFRTVHGATSDKSRRGSAPGRSPRSGSSWQGTAAPDSS